MSGKASLSDGLSGQVVGVLAAIALISALAGGVLALSLAIAEKWSSPGLYFLVTFAAVFCLAWLLGLSWWSSILKAIVGIEQPAPAQVMAAETFQVQVDHDTGDPAYLWVDNLAIPGDPDTITKAARMIAAGQPFTLACLGGRGKVMTRAEFEAMRDYLGSRGFCYRANNGPNSITLLNKAGESLMRKIAGRPTSEETHTPQERPTAPGLRLYSKTTDTHIYTQHTPGRRRA